MTQALNLANFANNLNTAGATSNTGLQNSSVTVTAGTGMSGGGAVALGSSVTLTNAGVTSVAAGTGISVSASTGGVTITNTVPTAGLAKAWAQFNGANGTVNGSYNISSIVRNSTGNYTVNFTTAMTNANYGVNATLSPNAAGTVNGGPVTMFTSGGGTLVTPTTSAFQFITTNLSASLIDSNWVSISVFGA